MVVDDVKLLTIFKGKRIKLTLKTSSFFGVVKRINSNKTLILTDVVDSDGCKFPGTKMFFGPEILNVEFTREENSGNIYHHRLEDHLDVVKFQPYRTTVTLDEEEECLNFVVIDEFHEKFGPAIMHIKKQHVIGVGAEGVELFKNGRLCWLQIATKKKVYLFDVLLLGARAFKNGLSMILESKHILKVIHDCRAIAGCLIAQFGVKLTNVFDTQVADVMWFYSEMGGFLPNRVSTLHEVVGLHLRVPSSQLSSLRMKSQITEEESQMWHKRPCVMPLLKVMALSVIHLQPLRLVLLDSLMTDYMALVDSYLNNSHYQPDELECVGMKSVLELPRELRQLEEVHHKRHEWASGHYPLTEQGLLVRFSPKPQPSSQASLAAVDHSENHSGLSEPATAEPDSSSQMKLIVDQSTTSPLSVTSVPAVDVQVPPPATVSDVTSQMSINSCLSAGMARETAGDIKTLRPMQVAPSQDKMPEPGLRESEPAEDVCGLSGEKSTSAPQPILFSLTQSFRSFRYLK